MGGLKNKEQVTFGKLSRGMSLADSLINSAVPMSKVSDSILSTLAQDKIRPGTIQPLSDKVAMRDAENKTFKICLDGKKINADS